MKIPHILVIYPMDNYTKIAIFRSVNVIFLRIIKHGKEELKKFKSVADQDKFRADAVIRELGDNEFDLKELDIVISRGGLTKPVVSGIYLVNDKMKADLKAGAMGVPALNLGGLIADLVAKKTPEAKAYIADPVVVDELACVARMTGHPMFKRKSVFHALHHKYLGRKYARTLSKNYEDMDLIIVHVGGSGVSVGAHNKGKVIDVNQAFDGEGPFGITRSGTLPAGDLVRLCFEGKMTMEEVLSLITSEGGMLAYLGTDSIDEMERRINEDDQLAKDTAYAMAYQIAKEIGAMYAVFEDKPDAIILSGEIFHCSYLTDHLSRHISKLGTIVLFPTVNDLDPLAMNALMVLNGEVKVLEYN